MFMLITKRPLNAIVLLILLLCLSVK